MEKQSYIKSDELGLIKFYSAHKQEFLKCIKEFIKQEENINYADLRKNAKLEKIEKDIEISILLEEIYKKTNDTITKEFIENWGHKITKYNEKSIKKTFERILLNYIKRNISKLFEKDLNNYMEFKEELINKFNELEKNLKIRDERIKEKEKQEKQKNTKKSLSELLEDDLEYIKLWNEKIIIENRIYTMNKKVKETTQEIESYYYLENNEEKQIINEFIKIKVEQIYNGKVKGHKFTKEDYEQLIETMKEYSNLMPATITLVSSEIKDLAKNQGITIKKIECIPFVKTKNKESLRKKS